MISKAAKKLHNNQRGVSILYSLLMLLVAALVVAVLLAAALTATKSIVNDKEVEQQYLTVSSAAQLVKDELDGCTYTTGTVTTYTEKGGEVKKVEELTPAASGSFKALINDAATSVSKGISYPNSSSAGKDFTVSVDSNTGLENVKMTFKMFADGASADYKQYDIRVIFSLVDTRGDTAPCLILELTSSDSDSTSEGYLTDDDYVVSTLNTRTWKFKSLVNITDGKPVE